MKMFTIGTRQFTVNDIHNIAVESFKNNDFKVSEMKKELAAFVDNDYDTYAKEIDHAVWYCFTRAENPGVIRVKRGTYRIYKSSDVINKEIAAATPKMDTNKNMELSLVPIASQDYVPHGCYSVVRKVLSKNIFAPIWVTGLSGNGKTMGVQEACAAEKRELITVNISNETSEEDLIGSYILENETHYEVEVDEELFTQFKQMMS